MRSELFPGAPVVAFDALFDGRGVGPRDWDDVWQTLRDVEVITAVDHMTGREVVVSGRRLLEQIRDSGDRRWVDVLRVGLDLDADELPRLRAAVSAAKAGT